VNLAKLTQDYIAQSTTGNAFSQSTSDQQVSINAAMQRQLHSIDHVAQVCRTT